MLTIPNTSEPLRSSLDLGQRLSDLETCLLPQPQDLEPLKICQGSSPLLLGALLGPRALLPLRLNTSLLPLRLDDTSSGAPGKLLKDKGCENELREGDRLTGDGGLGFC